MHQDQRELFRRARLCQDNGVDLIQDVSTHGELSTFRKGLIKSVGLPIGSVLAYEYAQSIKYYAKSKYDLRPILLDVMEKQVAAGVSFITLHAVLSRDILINDNKCRNITFGSRGSALLMDVMHQFNVDNPMNMYFEDLIEVAKEERIVIGLGSLYRPCSVTDYPNDRHNLEIRRQSSLADCCIQKGVPVYLEGISHIMLIDMKPYVESVHRLNPNIPITALGPLPTDAAVGDDDIAGAIGAAYAAMSGFSLVSIVTAAEHHRYPSSSDLTRAIRAYRVAVHASDIARGLRSCIDAKISEYRGRREWSMLNPWSINSNRSTFEEENVDGKPCTICADNCPLSKSPQTISDSKVALNYSRFNSTISRYPIPIQNLWWDALDLIPKRSVLSIFTFGSLVYGDYSLFYKRHTLASSDLEFLVVVDSTMPRHIQLDSLARLNEFSKQMSTKHAGFYASLKFCTLEDIQSIPDVNPVFFLTLKGSGLDISNGNILDDILSRSPRSISHEECCSYVSNCLSSCILHADKRLVGKEISYRRYVSMLICRCAIKATYFAHMEDGKFPHNMDGAIAHASRQSWAQGITKELNSLNRMRKDLQFRPQLRLEESVESFMDVMKRIGKHFAGLGLDAQSSDLFSRRLSLLREYLRAAIVDREIDPCIEVDRLDCAKDILRDKGAHYSYLRSVYGII
jgi:phosphomethylpyrimidine synthase